MLNMHKYVVQWVSATYLRCKWMAYCVYQNKQKTIKWSRPLCQVILSGSISRRTKRWISSSVNSAGKVFVIPSFYSTCKWNGFLILKKLDQLKRSINCLNYYQKTAIITQFLVKLRQLWRHLVESPQFEKTTGCWNVTENCEQILRLFWD